MPCAAPGALALRLVRRLVFRWGRHAASGVGAASDAPSWFLVCGRLVHVRPPAHLELGSPAPRPHDSVTHRPPSPSPRPGTHTPPGHTPHDPHLTRIWPASRVPQGNVLLRRRTCRQRPHRDRDLPGDQPPRRLQLQPRRLHPVRVLGRRGEWRAARRLRQSPCQARLQAALCTNLARRRRDVAGVVPCVRRPASRV